MSKQVKEIIMRDYTSRIGDDAGEFGDVMLIDIRAVKSSIAGQFAIEISDTGIGISEEELPRLFEHFTVLGDASSSKYGGTGLGLAVSMRLCLLMGGKIATHSVLGKGSCFTITLPIRANAANKSAEPAKTAAALTREIRNSITATSNRASVAA